MTRKFSLRTAGLFTIGTTGLALAGCHPQAKPGNRLDALDNQIVDGAAPGQDAATRALAKAIQVTPGQVTPGQATPGAREAKAPAAPRKARASGYCLDGLAYARDWAAKLPADLPIHPRASLQEAAGHDGACKARVVSFTVPGDRADVIAWYAARAKTAGYSADRNDSQGDWTLTGRRGDAVYDIMAGPTRAGVTPVDYVWAQGG